MKSHGTLLAGAALLLSAIGASPVESQAVPTRIFRDGSVGPGSDIQPIRSPSGVYEIGESLGARAGTNLFHSFLDFTIATGDTALFTANLPTDNVITRVTGGPSAIYGAIRSSIPGASLFFLNPAGIFFGPNASVNVQGSFHASTANVLRMKDEDGRDLIAFSKDSLLRMATPTAFGFLSNQPAPLTVGGGQISVPNGYNISLTGGGVEIRGGRLTARGGGIGLASVASKGDVTLGENGLAADGFERLGDIQITEKASLNVSEYSNLAGVVSIRGGRFVLDNSAITADVWDGSGGAIDIQVRNEAVLSNGASLRSTTDGSGNAASIRLEASAVVMSNASRIESTTQGSGNSSDVTLNATGSIVISNQDPTANAYLTGVHSDVTIGAQGAGGQITISPPSLSLQRGVISAETVGLGPTYVTLGQPGDIRIETNQLRMSDGALITNRSTSFDLSAGPAAPHEISIRPRDPLRDSSIALTGLGTNIQSTALWSTQGGASIKLKATDISLADRATVSTTVFGGAANAGEIAISADRIAISGGSQVLSEALMTSSSDPFAIPLGISGNITVQARDSISLEGGGLFTLGGTTYFLPSQISTATFGQGRGGNISLAAHNGTQSGSVIVDQGAIGSNNQSSFETASAGKVSVNADIVRVQNGGSIKSEAATGSSGPAGQVVIGATESLTVTGSNALVGLSTISTSTYGTGPAGDVSLSAPRVAVTDEAMVGSLTSGPGKGGNIQIGRTADLPIDTTDMLLQGGGFIAVSSVKDSEHPGGGAAGPVDINVARLTMQDGGQVLANTAGGSDGAGGSITVRASESATLVGIDPNDPQQVSKLGASTGGKGAAGNIFVLTPQLTIADGARIVAASNSSDPNAGAAGSIFVGNANQPVQNLTLSGGEISAFAVEGPVSGEPREGNIHLTANGIMLLEKGSSVTAGVRNGLGGDISFSRPSQLVLRDMSQILATTDIGTGGRIEIGSQVFIPSADSVVSADAGVGDAGVVKIDAPQVDLQGGLTAPAVNYLNASALLRPVCAARRSSAQEGHFVVAQRRALPMSEEGLLPTFVTSVSGSGADDIATQSDALRTLGQSLQLQGDYANSSDTLSQALKLAEKVGDQARVAAALDSLANAHQALGQSDDAEEELDRAVAIAGTLGNNRLLASLLNNTGNLRASQQDYTGAVETYERSAALAQKAGDTAIEAKAFANAARAAIEGSLPEGQALLEQASARLETLADSSEMNRLRIHLAVSYEQIAKAGRPKQEANLLAAYGLLTMVIPAARQSGDARTLSSGLGHLGALYQNERRYKEALCFMREAPREAEIIDASDLLYRWR